jgi:Recombination endonuclease VII
MGRKRLFNEDEKWCPKCGQWLSLDAFDNNKASLSGKQDYCRLCHSPMVDRSYENVILRKRNITPVIYLSLWEKQDKKCAICSESIIPRTVKQKTKDGAVLDHDHATEKVRGLLCSTCNQGLGSFKDSIFNLEKAITYLKNPPAFEVLDGSQEAL